MPRIEGSAGPSPVSDSYSKSTDNQVATVQVGENKLSDIAKRLNVDAKGLQQANPHISDSTNLKVGQEINLPQNQASEAPEKKDNDGGGVESQASELPHAPIGDPLAKNFMEAKLEGTSKQKEARELSEKDLAQVSGGDQRGSINALKWNKGLDVDDSRGAHKNSDKWIKTDESIHTQKSLNKVQLDQVAGGVHTGTIANKGAYKEADYMKITFDSQKTVDKSSPAQNTSSKAYDLAKIETTAQDVTINKAKTADKAYAQMEGYIKQ
jgi:bacteriocin-like protein